MPVMCGTATSSLAPRFTLYVACSMFESGEVRHWAGPVLCSALLFLSAHLQRVWQVGAALAGTYAWVFLSTVPSASTVLRHGTYLCTESLTPAPLTPVPRWVLSPRMGVPPIGPTPLTPLPRCSSLLPRDHTRGQASGRAVRARFAAHVLSLRSPSRCCAAYGAQAANRLNARHVDRRELRCGGLPLGT